MKIAALVTALAIVGGAQAQVTLDDFTSGPATIRVTSGLTYWQQSGSMVGGQRAESLGIVSNPFTLPLDVNIVTGFASVSQGAGMVSNVSIGYGYTASADHTSIGTFDLGLDLSSQSSFALTVSYDQDPMTADIMLNNNPADVAQFSVTPGTNTTYHVAFSQFAGVNFADIHQISVDFQDSNSNDFTVSSFTAAPEPLSMAFLGMGVVGLLVRKRLF